jgi:hypothetical protein
MMRLVAGVSDILAVMGITRDGKLQRALLQFFKPLKYFEVPKGLIKAEWRDLIGGSNALVPTQPPRKDCGHAWSARTGWHAASTFTRFRARRERRAIVRVGRPLDGRIDAKIVEERGNI